MSQAVWVIEVTGHSCKIRDMQIVMPRGVWCPIYHLSFVNVPLKILPATRC